MTKKCLHQEWNLSIEQAIETEAEAQAICMQTKDFTRAVLARRFNVSATRGAK